MQRFCRGNDAWIDNQRLEPLHVRFIDIVGERGHSSLSIFRQRRERFARDRVHLGDDAAGVRLDHLRAIGKVNFVAVVVRWVMARRDNDTSAGAQISHGK